MKNLMKKTEMELKDLIEVFYEIILERDQQICHFKWTVEEQQKKIAELEGKR